VARVMVTGCNGYIGSVLVAKLIEDGHDVRGMDSGLFEDCVFGRERLVDVDVVHKDVRDATYQDFQGFDSVVHLAALSNDPMCNVDPVLTFDINYRAASKAATMAKWAGVKQFVFYSSCSVYGKTPHEVDESGHVNPLTAYAMAKLLAEGEIASMYDDSFKPVILRNATVFGYSPRQRLDLIIPDMVFSALTEGKVVLRSSGTTQRPHVSIKDLSALTSKIVAGGSNVWKLSGRRFNVVGFNATALQVATAVAEVTGCGIVHESNEVDARDYLVGGHRIESVLNWKPFVGLRQGIREIVERFKTFALRLDDEARTMCVRLHRLNELRGAGRLDGELRWTRESQTDGAYSS